MRIKYVLSGSEVEALVAGLAHNGPSNMYELMKGKIAAMMVTSEEMDMVLMDMQETILQFGREIDAEESPEMKQLKDIYYILASMLRRLAHESHFAYIKNGKLREDDRFLRLVHDNKEAPPIFKPEES